MEISTSRIDDINRVLLAYAAGRFKAKAKISDARDDFDSILAGLNMLGEQLENTTVSHDFFSSIYNATTDMLFVVNRQGIIKTANEPACRQLGFNSQSITSKKINSLVDNEDIPDFTSYLNKGLKTSDRIGRETVFYTSAGQKIPVEISCSKMLNQKNVFTNFLVVANDITERKQVEQKIYRSILEAQQQEQSRISKDLHELYGLALTDIKYEFAHVLYGDLDDMKREKIQKGLLMLDEAIANIRNICSNLMPSSLEYHGLIDTLKQNIPKWNISSSLQLTLLTQEKKIEVEQPVEINMYFIILEFINNSKKYSGAQNLYIRVYRNKAARYVLDLKDDGCGFNYKKNIHSGRGLTNIALRIRAFNGSHRFITSPGKGTQLIAEFPMKPGSL